MAYDDWRDVTDQSAFTPLPEKIESTIELLKDFTYYSWRPFHLEFLFDIRKLDNVTFLDYWLQDVLEYIVYENESHVVLYDVLKRLDRLWFKSEIENLDMQELVSGDVIFLSTDDDFTTDDPTKYYCGVWISEDMFLAMDMNGFIYGSFLEVQNAYPQFTNVTVFRI